MTVNILMLNAASYTRYRIKNLERPTDPQQKPKNDRECLKFAIGLPAEPKSRWGGLIPEKVELSTVG